jgi:hypothetical protein
MPAKMKGLETTLSAFDTKQVQLGKGFKVGLTRAALYLQGASQKLTPVDTGNLRASAFTRVTGDGLKAKAKVGYTAMYALFVHENVEMKLKGQPRPAPHKGSYWDPQGRAQSKFLEQPMRTEAPKMLELMAEPLTAATKAKV